MAASAQPPGRKPGRRQPDPVRSAAAKKAAATRRKNKAQTGAKGTPASGTKTPPLSQIMGKLKQVPRPSKRALVPAAIVAVLGLVFLAATSILDGGDGEKPANVQASLFAANPGGSEEPEEPAEEPEEQTGGFDMEACLDTEVRVPVGPEMKPVKRSKSKEFCETQADLAGRNPLADLGNTEPKSHHGKDGTVVFRGWVGLSESEQVRALYRWSLQDPVVAAMALYCYSKDSYSKERIDAYRTAKPGSHNHRQATRALHAMMTHPGFSFDNYKLYGKWFNESVNAAGQPSGSQTTHNGTASTQATIPAMVLPDGQVIPGGKTTQLHRCINCQRKQLPPAIPPKQPSDGPGPGPGPSPEGRHPAQPGGDNLGGGRPPQRGGDYGDTHRRVPNTPATPKRRPIIQPDTPVRTPPGTGGEIKPSDPPPQSDSGGGTVTEPTAPPTPQPSEPPAMIPLPLPPEWGAPPPPPAEQGAPPPPSSTSTSAAPPPPPPE
ncbi:MAG: hypothetical protein WD603_00765 [Patescibacteria group bacterium]